MIDRLRALLDRPLDPSAARAILALSSATLVGFAALFVLAAGEPDRQASPAEQPPSIASPPAPATPAEASEGERPGPRPSTRRQDPQDVKGSAAGRRAAQALRSHLALQHVPYRDGELRIALVGARGDRAVLRVSAPTVRLGKRGWHRFLRRYRDSGRAYFPRFEAAGGHGDRPPSQAAFVCVLACPFACVFVCALACELRARREMPHPEGDCRLADLPTYLRSIGVWS